MLMNVIFLLVFIFLYLLYLDCRKPKGYPPGPRWWPILGCMLEIARIRREVKYFSKICSKFHDKYGPIVGFKIGINRIVVFNDICSIRAMLFNKDCDGRPIGKLYDGRDTSSAWQGMFVKDEQQSAVQRRFLMRYFQEFNRTNMDVVEDEAQKLLEHLKELQDVGKCPKINNNNINNDNRIYNLQKDVLDKCDKLSVGEDKTLKHKLGTTMDFYSKTEEYEEVDKVCESKEMIIEMIKILELSNLNTVWRIIVGKRLEINDKRFAHLYRIIKQAIPDNIFRSLFNHFPILSFIIPETSDHKLYIKGFKELLKSLKKELHYCKKTLDPDARPKSLMDAYLIALSSGEIGDSMNEYQLIAICKEFLLAVNTTSHALAFGFLYMILYPQIQEKAQEEIDRVVGRDRFPTLADKSKMPYIQAVVLESIRMFSKRAVSIPHNALKDTTVLGYNIPKDTLLLVNFGAIACDQNDSEKFRPERFFDSDGNIVVPDNYIYFSLGKHHCIGEMFAKSHMFIIISTLLQKFNFSVVPGEPQPSTEDITDKSLPSPKSFKALVSLRE